MQSKPQLLVWLMCDGVHVDPMTGKHTILGVFSHLACSHFPAIHPRMIWFLTISDVSAGDHTVRISLGLDPAKLEKLIERPFASPGPLEHINMINDLHGVPFPQAGDYSILIEIDDEPLLATTITVTLPPS